MAACLEPQNRDGSVDDVAVVVEANGADDAVQDVGRVELLKD